MSENKGGHYLDSVAYAVEQSVRTGSPYAVWVNLDYPEYYYTAYFCKFNKKSYKEIGASVWGIARKGRFKRQ